jgi:hypothetical protein
MTIFHFNQCVKQTSKCKEGEDGSAKKTTVSGEPATASRRYGEAKRNRQAKRVLTETRDEESYSRFNFNNCIFGSEIPAIKVNF